MPIRCASSGCNNTKESGRIFAHCNCCNTWWCSRHGTKGNRCPGCGHKYLDGASSSGGCFITTATLIAIGKGDDCHELQTFRNFRDTWVLDQPGGVILVEEYYRLAPQIVSAINTIDKKDEIYAELWQRDIYPCLKLLEEGLWKEALCAYKNSMRDLSRIYLDIKEEAIFFTPE